jgi:hypothetical protein
MIRLFLLLAVVVPATLLPAFSRTRGSCEDVFTTAFEPGRKIEMELRAGDIDVIGTAEPEVRVVCHLDEPAAARDVSIEFDSTSHGGRLMIHGGPHKGFRVRIYIPENTALDADCAAGNVVVEGVTGDKDLQLRAGNLTIRGMKATEYARVDASVTAGNVTAGEHRSGLFRSVKRNNSGGKYTLKAHVSAGNIEVH